MKKVIIFDFDGVFVNTLDIVMEGHRIKNPDITHEQFLDYLHGNEIFFGEIPHDLTLDEGVFSLYGPKLMKEPIFGEFDKVIKNLARDYILVIVSSSREDWMEKYFEKYNLLECLNMIMGINYGKDKIKKFEDVMGIYKVGPRDCIYVTDTLGDIKDGNKVGIRSIGVDWGYHDQEILLKGNPVAVISKPQELSKIVKKYF